ncbi:hypothetical protein GCM10023191_067300 [Actinoallomurus oryzae]|uniref:HTH lysR-type domain-containing protein n=1 Tax=Actinoallomurus oryzae TaxID=502180 RepID=A0ABP8QU61_9ACTN
MDLRLLGYVVAIAEEGSISGAARRLRLTQPTLSRQLRDLERRLGAELFVRAGRGLIPTAAGEALLRRAVRMLADAEAALNDVRLAAEGRTGRLTVGFAGSGINGALGDALGRLRAELPDVDLSLVELFDDAEMSAGVLDGSLDVAVQRLPVRDARLAIRVWAREPLALFLPAGHPLARTREPAPVSVLGQTPWCCGHANPRPMRTTRSPPCATTPGSCRASAHKDGPFRRSSRWSPPVSVPP